MTNRPVSSDDIERGAKAAASSEPTIIRAWASLAGLDRLEFVARPGPGSDTGWAGRGWGQAAAQVLDAHRLRLVESGRFQPALPRGSARTFVFNNTYLWERRDDTLRLSHERFGAAHAVFLFALRAAAPGRLLSRETHLCGADRYSAEMNLDDHGFTLDWRILGPAKDERLCYRYFMQPGDSRST